MESTWTKQILLTSLWSFTQLFGYLQFFGYFIIFTSYLPFLANSQTYLATSYYLQNYFINGSSE